MMSRMTLSCLIRRCSSIIATPQLNSYKTHITSRRSLSTKTGHGVVKGETFEELLESSPLMKIRRPQGTAVIGEITNVCNDDLYVDFGGKFEVVVKKPAVKSDQYQVGTKVRIMLKRFEMTGHFLGQNKHITLLEADGRLMGLY